MAHTLPLSFYSTAPFTFVCVITTQPASDLDSSSSASRRVQVSLRSLLSGDILVDGHVFLEAGESALSLHGGEVLGLEVHHALLIADAIRLVQVLGCRVETIGFSGGHGVHDFLLLIILIIIMKY